MQNILSDEDVEGILIQEGFKPSDILLEDDIYQIMSGTFFETSFLGKVFGLERWNYALGGSDCGKFSVRLAGQLFKKYQDSQRADYFQGSNMPACLIGFVKYRRLDGITHIVNATVLNTGGKYHVSYFERTETGIHWVVLSDQEKATLVYFHAY